MRIIFDATQKTTRNRPFGLGILASRPVHRAPVSLADMKWAAANLNEPAIDWEAEFSWVEAMDLIEAGFCYL